MGNSEANRNQCSKWHICRMRSWSVYVPIPKEERAFNSPTHLCLGTVDCDHQRKPLTGKLAIRRQNVGQWLDKTGRGMAGCWHIVNDRLTEMPAFRTVVFLRKLSGKSPFIQLFRCACILAWPLHSSLHPFSLHVFSHLVVLTVSFSLRSADDQLLYHGGVFYFKYVATVSVWALLWGATSKVWWLGFPIFPQHFLDLTSECQE